MNISLKVMIISGVEDGMVYRCSTQRGDGVVDEDSWTLLLGRHDDCDIRVQESFVSRQHAHIKWRDGQWYLIDLDSRNGTFIPRDDDFFRDRRIKGLIPINADQLFRLGRIWLSLLPEDGP